MKFDDRLLAILKNFGSINPSLEFKASDLLRTGSIDKTVIAEASLPADLPAAACVYDLNRFLQTLGLFNDPEVEFGDKAFTIKEGTRKVKYTYADVEMINKPKDKRPTISNANVEVSLKWDDLNTVLKAASVLGHPNIGFTGDGKACRILAFDKEKPDNDAYSIVIGQSADTFKIILDLASMKLLQDDYEVKLADNMASFSSADVTYFMAIDKSSTYQKAAVATIQDDEDEE